VIGYVPSILAFIHLKKSQLGSQIVY